MLPTILRRLVIEPYFKLSYRDGEAFCDIERITGEAKAFLTVRQTETQNIVAESIPIAEGHNVLPGLSRGLVYDLCPYMEENDAFGFSSEITELTRITGAACEDWTDLEGCMLSVASIVHRGERLESQYGYFLMLEEKIGEARYLGSLFGRRYASDTSSDSLARDDLGSYKTSKLGRAMITVVVGEKDLQAFPRLFSYVDDKWICPLYDRRMQMLLHADDWLLTQKNENAGRFLKLDPTNSIMDVNIDKIRRIQYVISTI